MNRTSSDSEDELLSELQRKLQQSDDENEPLSAIQRKYQQIDMEQSSDSDSNFGWGSDLSDLCPTKIIPLSKMFPSDTAIEEVSQFQHDSSDGYQLDSSGTDEDFIPSKTHINYSDSESDPSFLDESESGSDGNSDVIVVKQNPCNSSSESETGISDIAKAMKRSLIEKRRKTNILAIHMRRLDVLLKSNGLQRQKIPKNGNCFFEAVSKSKNIVKSAETIRMEVCEHIAQLKNHYIEYLVPNETNQLSESDILETSREEYFNSQVQFLKEDGHWTADLADLLPMAVSNLYGTNITIYTSQQSQPVISVQPSLAAVDLSKENLSLAFCSPQGMEHYDACTTMSVEHAQQGNYSDSQSYEVTPKKRKSERELFRQITPRKQTKFTTPPKKVLTRKRKVNPEKWKKNIRKTKRQKGDEYVNATGEIVPKRAVQKQDCSKCRFKCSSKVSEERRQSIFDSFWNLNSRDRQRDFIDDHVLERESRGCADTKRKQVARIFQLNAEGKTVKVCKRFFLATLNIGRKFLDCALKIKASESKARKHRSPHNKTPETDKDSVRHHIESFPTVESHYTRKDSKRKYLSCDLTINKMYSLYKDEQIKAKQRAVSSNVYRGIFCKEYNLSFHKPKKDQCNICNEYTQKKKMGTVNDTLKLNYDNHQQRKTEARQEKEKDKTRAKSDLTFNAATFDMESVLTTPCSLVNQAYYKRKLCCYNLSVYSLGDSKGHCYLWNETEGKRGSCEVGSCLLMYLNSLPKEVEHVSLFSDTCGGQNKNKFIATALLYSVSSSTSIKVIDQKFLEPGHTQMECDSMHSAIEFAKKHTSIFVPSHWDTVVHMARRTNPYTVIPMKHWDFKDLKEASRAYITNTQYDESGEKVQWKDIKHIRVSKENPGTIQFKTSLQEENFRVLKRLPSTRRTARKHDDIPARYTERLAVTEQKKKDLLSLCSANIIPEEYWQFYKMLPTEKKTKEKLPEPDVLEEDIDSDE